MPAPHDSVERASRRRSEFVRGNVRRLLQILSVRKVGSWLRQTWATLLFLLVAAGLLGWVSWEAVWLRTETYGNSSDYWEHSAVLRALMENPWHPRNPHLVSDASSPRFGPQFLLVALLARIAHWDALGAMSLAAVLNTLLFLWGIRTFFSTYFRDPIAPLYGLLVMFCSWWHAWPYSNVYQLQVFFGVASYPSSTAIGLTLLGFALAVRILRSEVKHPRWCLALLGAWALSVFVIHQLTAVMSLSGVGLLAITEPKVRWRLRLGVIGAIVLGSALSHFWPYFSPWEVLRGGKSDAAHWMSESVEQAVALHAKPRRHFFYRQQGIINALGLCLLTVVTLPFFFWRRERWFVSLGALSMLLPFAVNAYIDLPLGHRFILLAILYLQVGVVWLLLTFTPGYAGAPSFLRSRWAQVPCVLIIVGILGTFSYHNLAATQHQQSAARFRARSVSPVVGYANMVANHVSPNSVILATPLMSWALPTFGPKVVVLLHPNPLVPDDAERTALVARFLNQRLPDGMRRQILTHFGVTHVLVQRTTNRSLSDFLNRNATGQPVGGGVQLYTLR